ncbi:hypothetical protein PFISCL1PPCAC_7808, partial [Pristionchus fissidentatus]
RNIRPSHDSIVAYGLRRELENTRSSADPSSPCAKNRHIPSLLSLHIVPPNRYRFHPFLQRHPHPQHTHLRTTSTPRDYNQMPYTPRRPLHLPHEERFVYENIALRYA